MHEYVGYLEVSMNDIFWFKVLKSFVDISNNIVQFPLFQFLLLFNFVLQISFVTQLCDDVAVSIAGKYLKTAQNVGVIELFENLDLWE